jgi:hypothetical protein
MRAPFVVTVATVATAAAAGCSGALDISNPPGVQLDAGGRDAADAAPGCPVTRPAQGTACSAEDLRCKYDDQPPVQPGVPCSRDSVEEAICGRGTWSYVTESCNPPQPLPDAGDAEAGDGGNGGDAGDAASE